MAFSEKLITVDMHMVTGYCLTLCIIHEFSVEWYDKDDTSVCTFQDATCVEIYSCMSSAVVSVSHILQLTIYFLGLASNTVNNSKCDCPIPCSQRKFDVQVSQAAFPAPHLDEIIARKFNVSLNYVRYKQ